MAAELTVLQDDLTVEQVEARYEQLTAKTNPLVPVAPAMMPNLTARQNLAAMLYGVGNLPRYKLGPKVQVPVTTINHWFTLPDFQAAIEAYRQDAIGDMYAIGIANRDTRLMKLQQALDDIEAVQTARRDDESLEGIPGAETGMVIHTVKQIGFGRNAETIHEYQYDKALAAEKRATLEQAAKESGQWMEKHQHQVQAVVIHVKGIDPDSDI